ncbi:MAG: hypothetical protein HN742_40935 [Lentisphaerae bacterium]|nr:hypothetical protein [Lentisphaerota bacterium]MBT7848302.1 hypothetical protein [Lentisphaerota bacterium]
MKTRLVTTVVALGMSLAAGCRHSTVSRVPAMVEPEFTGPSISVRLDANPAVSADVTYLSAHDESRTSFVKRQDSGGWREERMMYFVAEDERFKQGRTPLVKVVIDYFDEGRGLVVIKYDSSDKYVNPGKNAGVWKTEKAMVLTDSRQWRTAETVIADANFANRCNGGDFRLESRTPFVVRALRIVAASPEDQERSRVALRNAPPPLEAKIKPFALNMDEVLAQLRPYRGPSKPGTDASTLTNKVMCGYQGWFDAPGDGSGQGWTHYNGPVGFQPGSCSIDLWPDVSELDDDEKHETYFRHRDGSTAYVYSPMNRKSVVRHCQWMAEAGIDGVFVQRFASVTGNPKAVYKNNTVLMNIREGANRHGRAYALMYDLSGGQGAADRIIADWKSLVDGMALTKDPNDRAYQRHNGRPVVALWGLFANREYCLPVYERLLEFFKNDPTYGGCTVKVGVNNDWRSGKGPNHDRVRRIIMQADIVSPWTPGRYGTPEGADRHMQTHNVRDQEWCDARGKDYMPVIFPGFSWHNMHHGNAALGAIPRLQGRFFWRQAVAAKAAGARMLYIAMFDEVDEGTAIFKCTNAPPVGASPFLDYEDLPSDYYMWLAGQARLLLENELKPTRRPPPRPGLVINYKSEDGTGLPEGLDEISVVLADPQDCRGLRLKPQGGESRNVPTVKGGRPAWVSTPMPDPNEGRKMYLKVEYAGFRNGRAPRIRLAIDYFDNADTEVRVVYDSADKSWNPSSSRPGAWKEAGRFALRASNTWKTATFDIPDALFVGRCNGFDIRLEFAAGVDLALGAVRIRKLPQ